MNTDSNEFDKLTKICQLLKKPEIDAFNDKYENIYGKLDNLKVRDIIAIELKSFPKEITISVEQARTTSMQFNTKRNYVQLGRIDLDLVEMLLWNNLFQDYESTKSLSEAFFNTMKMGSGIIKDKYSRLDNALNGLIRSAEEKDSILPLPNSRFDK